MPLYHVKISWTLIYSNATIDRAHLWTSGTTRQKTSIFSRISPDKLDRFSQSFHRMKAFWANIIHLDLFFWFVKGHCHGNQIILGEVINADWYYLHSLLLHSKTNRNITVCVRINSSNDWATSEILVEISGKFFQHFLAHIFRKSHKSLYQNSKQFQSNRIKSAPGGKIPLPQLQHKG